MAKTPAKSAKVKTPRGKTPGAQTLWHGRFASGPSDSLMAYTESLSFDRRLGLDDIAGSRAHVRGLAGSGLMTQKDARMALDALDEVEAELLEGRVRFKPSDEDIHTVIERRVTEIAGEAGARIHTGRSRNDQVATAFRLFLKRELTHTAERVIALMEVLSARANEAGAAPLPGFTHLQPAQPVTLAHHLLAHCWGFARDLDRLHDARRRLDVSPLGAGALGGSGLPLDPAGNAKALGFAAAFENSLDAVSDRDFVADALYALAMIGVRLSKMGEEIVLWSSSAFGFVVLDDSYSTGSSMLPQKKNPDIAELARGKAGRVIGDLAGFLATLKSLPLAYNRDLQEDKEPVFDALDQVNRGLEAFAGMYDTMVFQLSRMKAAASAPELAALDIADALVARGTPFRQAHAEVGALAREAAAGGAALDALAKEKLGVDFGKDGWSAEASLARRVTRGGAGPKDLARQKKALAARIAKDKARFG